MIRNEHRESRWKFPFVEYSPETDERLPLIIQLHGAGERGDSAEEMYKAEAHGFREILAASDRYKCMYVMPQCSKTTFWAARIESILEFIEQLKAEFNIDEKKIYLTGFSMGGFGTWYTAMAKPEIFAAIAPICGGGMAWNAGVLDMPVWVWHGALDKVVDTERSDEMVESLKGKGKNVIYTRVDGVGHNVWDYAYKEELLEWLLDKSL